MAIVRQRVTEWGIDTTKVGILGFRRVRISPLTLQSETKQHARTSWRCYMAACEHLCPPTLPPAFIAAAADDEYQPNDAAQLFAAWRQAGVAAELHIYEHGGHGFDLRPTGTTSDNWFDALVQWMQTRGLMVPTNR